MLQALIQKFILERTRKMSTKKSEKRKLKAKRKKEKLPQSATGDLLQVLSCQTKPIVCLAALKDGASEVAKPF